MDERMEKYLAKQEIYELVCTYMRGLDRLDGELLRSTFHADAWCDYGFIQCGGPEFADFCMQALQDHAANHHMIGNVLIDVDGDEAFGEVYFNAYHKVPAGDGFEDVIIAGRYLDRYARREGVWKFAYRSEVVDFSHTRPSNDPYFEQAPNGLRGGRMDDAVYDRRARYRP